MEIKQINQFPRQTVEQWLAVIPFYKTVRQQDPWQFEVLLQHSRIVDFAPGEVVLKFGEADTWLYFLLKGQLAVYADGQVGSVAAVNHITPGEVFGDLAMLVDDQRTATLVADSDSRRITAFGTDFTVFGALDDFSKISLKTKLVYYRNTVHSLRWKLEVYRTRYPEYELANHHHRVKLYHGVLNTAEELISLHEQAVQLARLLLSWNRRFGSLSFDGGKKWSSERLASTETE